MTPLSTPPPRRVLVVLLGAIGDVVRALPLVQRLRAGWPATRIAWAVEPAAAPLLRAHPAIDEVILFDRPRGLPAFAELARGVRRSAPELALDLQRHLKSGLTSWLSGAPRRLGFAWANSREGNWLFNNEYVAPVERFSAKIEHYLRFADHLGLPPSPLSFGLTPTPEEEQRVEAALAAVARPFAAFFVGASVESRLWHPGPAADLVDRLAARGVATVLLGGRADVAMARQIEARARVTPANLAGATALRDLIGIFARARVALGPDTGPMHIAAAVGRPVVALFGATSPARSAPYGFEHLVVRGEAPCSPCYARRCPIGRLCMESISADAVLAKIDAVLDSRAGEGARTQ